MPYTNNGKHLMLNALAGTNPTTPITHMSLHTANPGETGASEISGGGYARQSVAFNAASGGSIDDSGAAKTFSVPASTTVAYVGFFSAVSAGTFLAYADVTDEVFAGAGTYSVTDADLDLNA